jgi:hypothetical protein
MVVVVAVDDNCLVARLLIGAILRFAPTLLLVDGISCCFEGVAIIGFIDGFVVCCVVDDKAGVGGVDDDKEGFTVLGMPHM